MPKFAHRSWMLGMLLAALSGCGPRIDQSELGQISKTLPAVPGTDQPFPLPDLEVPSAVDAAAAGGQAAATPEKPPKDAENAAPADQSP